MSIRIRDCQVTLIYFTIFFLPSCVRKYNAINDIFPFHLESKTLMRFLLNRRETRWNVLNDRRTESVSEPKVYIHIYIAWRWDIKITRSRLKTSGPVKAVTAKPTWLIYIHPCNNMGAHRSCTSRSVINTSRV